MTLPFDHTHDLDLGVEISRSESEIALSQEWEGWLPWNQKDVSHPFMTMILTSVTMVEWADVPDSDWGDFRRRRAIDISSLFGWHFFKICCSQYVNPLPNWIDKFDGDALIYKIGCRPSHNPLFVIIGRSPRRRFPDHAFMPHCTFSPHLLAQQGVRRAPEGEGVLAGGI